MNYFISCLILAAGILVADGQPWSLSQFLGQISDELHLTKGSSTSNETRNAKTSCECGAFNRRRIVNGIETQPNEYPFVVSLINTLTRDHFCGGSILTESYVITAAHCTSQNKLITVVVGLHNQRRRGPMVQESRVLRTIEHEDYEFSSKTVNNDISILVLRTPLKFNSNVMPVCMPVTKLKLHNEHLKIIGWGKTGMYASASPFLQHIDVTVLTPERCKSVFTYRFVDENTQMCASNPRATACMGDSGGPAVWLDPETNRYTLVGLVSFALPGCIPGLPTVQADVSAFVPWVESHVKGLCHKV